MRLTLIDLLVICFYLALILCGISEGIDAYQRTIELGLI